MSLVNAFLLRGITLGYAVAGLFFARFWRDTADRFFGFLALAFWLLALHWGVLPLSDPAYEHRPLIFLLRLLAFLVVLVGIADKNRPPTEPPSIPEERESFRS